MKALLCLVLSLSILAPAAVSAGEFLGPELRLDGTLPLSLGVPLQVPIDFLANGFTISAIVFSLDLDLDRLDFDPTDANGDGVPDAVHFPFGTPGLVMVSFDAGDTDGELDFLLANLSGLPLPEGLLVEIELTPTRNGWLASHIAFATDPPVSFGDDQGNDVPGSTIVTGTTLFADGFESGDLSAW